MWGPSLIERLLAKWGIIDPPLTVSVFLFLLGHTHNLLRSVLHAVFAQQVRLGSSRFDFHTDSFWSKSQVVMNEVGPKTSKKDRLINGTYRLPCLSHQYY